MKKLFKAIKDEIVFIYVEVKKSFSNEESYFSSKRIERALLFITGLVASNVWFWHKYPDLGYGEIIAYVSTHLAFAGYSMATTQKEKRFDKTVENESTNTTDG